MKCSLPFKEPILGSMSESSFVAKDENGKLHFTTYKRHTCTCGASLGPAKHIDDYRNGHQPVRPNGKTSLTFSMADKLKKIG